jgi:hypothetical protein
MAATLHSTPQRAAAIVTAHINPGCKDLEEDRGGREVALRKGEELAELATQCFRCCRNTTVVTTVVKFKSLCFRNISKFIVIIVSQPTNCTVL